ncbi:MAG: hypothetical protein U0869_07555 [Chloroflexota bacterium]
MRVHRLIGPLLAALLAVATTGLPAAATGVGGATWSPKHVRMVITQAGYRTYLDSVYVFLELRWDKAGVRALRDYEAQGWRYTQEVNDLSGRLSGTGSFVSDLPGASYDRDDDDGDGRWEEVEVTATEAGAIKAGRTYHVGFHLTRWSRTCDDCRWTWTHKGGRAWGLSQLSSNFLGEWQAMRWTNPWASVRYSHMAKPRR